MISRRLWERGSRLAITACMALVAGCGRGEPPLFPTGQGSTWTYQGDKESIPIRSEARVVSSRVEGVSRTVVVAWTTDGQPAQDETYLVTAHEVLRSKAGLAGQTSLDPPLPILKLPLQAGKRWTWNGKVRQEGLDELHGSAVFHVVAKETTKTLAGDFEAFRVGMSMELRGAGRKAPVQVNRATVWYAPGVGIVKQFTDQSSPDTETREASRVLAKVEIKQ